MADSRQHRTLRVLQVSDTHLHAAPDSRMRGVRTYATFKQVLEHVQRDRRWPPDVVIATGDIVQDESRAGYELFRSTLEPFDVPVISIPGNHDDPKLMAEILSRGSFQFGGEARHGSWSLLCLSTFLAGEDAGGLGHARLNGLRKALAAHAGQHVLVAMHHHPLPMGSAWLDGVALRDAAAFWDVISEHPNVRAVVCGHVHQQSERTHNGVMFASTPSTCAQFSPNSEFFALDERPPAARWLELHPDGRIETEVTWARGSRT
ncbi:MAG TPA: 3',5'-cyclic-AMP phosphodiesterase, partial [Gammaproteobacteria bacterium]|nr:3',5'-cyclic-AMP phosphodiesterase [Gammaproteobacteria bacterium]